MDGWSELEHELDDWHRAGRVADLWWRDDDVIEPSPLLDRLLALAGEQRCTVGLAVIPSGAVPALARRLAGGPGVEVLQHGFAHRNHAPAGEKAQELGAHRPLGVVLAELELGRGRLATLFGDVVLPVLAPPWNRIADTVVAALPRLGFRGLSAFAPRRVGQPVPGLAQTNCHVDPVDWRGGGGFRGDGPALASVLDHLRARRTGQADPDEPTGLLTHHLRHDEGCWSFLGRLLALTGEHPGARWRSPREAILGG
jgi:peptidoglycan/xylan/chitin deacetylase (PgdA/CDA1 family)